MSAYTPYRATKIVNEMIKDRGVERTLPPQMLYNYTAKGYIPSTKTEDGKRTVTHQDLVTWFEGYFQKNLAPKTTAVEVDEDQLELDLSTDES